MLTAGAVAVSASGVTAGSELDPEGTVRIEDQHFGGESIELAEVSISVDGVLTVIDDADGQNTLFAREEIDAGTDETEYSVELDEPIEESQTIRVWLFAGSLSDDDAESLAIDDAYVTVGDESAADVLGKTFVEADPEAGFNYPFYLFTPSSDADSEVPILVEPNNTGTATDEFAAHKDAAEQRVGRGTSRTVSEDLSVPLLVPVFPRPQSDPVDWTHYVHALDDTTMSIEDGDLERVDLQLLAMVEYAKEEVLNETGHVFSDQLMMNGFSAAGNFADRFAVLHPDRVLSVTAGGLNGMALLPLEEADGHTLDYHVGIANVESLTGNAVDLDALDEVNQFLYMGSLDENDTIPYDDAWTDEELRNVALSVYGDDMIAERFPRCQQAYEQANVEAQFKIYENAGHTPQPATDDIIEFHRRSLDGEDVSDFGEDITGSQVNILTPLSVGVSAIRVSARVSDEQAAGSYELRAYSDQNGDITEESVALSDGSVSNGELTLTTPVSDGDSVTVALMENGDTELDQAITTVTEEAVNTAVSFSEDPVSGDSHVTVEYVVDSGLKPDSLRLRVYHDNGEQFNESPHVVTPGDDEEGVRLGTDRELEEGDEIVAAILTPGGYSVDDARQSGFAVAETTVGSAETSTTTTSAPQRTETTDTETPQESATTAAGTETSQEPESTSTDADSTQVENSSTGADGPGFGIVSTAAGLGVIGQLLRGDSSEES